MQYSFFEKILCRKYPNFRSWGVNEELKPIEEMQLGHYTLTVRLANGIFSETWLAEHMYLEGKKNCIKIFTNSKLKSELQKQKFLRLIPESPYFPHIDDYDPTAPLPYIAQEVIKGRSLRYLLRECKQLPMNVVYKIFKNTLLVLQTLHNYDIAHLDVRPEHMIIDEQYNVKLLDYEIGQITTSTIADYYKEFALNGTPLQKPIMRSLLYKSKQHRAGTDRTIRADIFSLGIIFFEMITGTYPTKKAEFPSVLVPEAGETADQIFAGCCSRTENYYNTCEEILNDIKIDTQEKPLPAGVSKLRDNAITISISALVDDKTYVDGKNISTLSKNLEEIIKNNFKFYAFDLQNIEYLNSSAIGFLAHFHDRIQNIGGTTVFFHVDRKVITILSALGLEKVIHIVPTVKEAEEYLFSRKK